MAIEPKGPYADATKKLLAEGFALNARTCFYERGVERLKLRWNGKVYARRRGPPKPQDPILIPDPSENGGDQPLG
ncbi:hypothetical protein LJR219_003971 [Phenylobacterium sp. LjRoot219]|uniref:hypothetical protein n=1 Tax=Phenylobacterium sp. LjRoot219 TaxID=3342283 RepID=UPI003ED12DFF